MNEKHTNSELGMADNGEPLFLQPCSVKNGATGLEGEDIPATSGIGAGHDFRQKTLLVDAALLAEAIREFSAREVLATREDLLPVFQNKLRLALLEESVKATGEQVATTADNASGEAEQAETAATDARILSRRDVFNSILALRQRYLENNLESHPESGPETMEGTTVPEPAVSQSDLADIPLPTRVNAPAYVNALLAATLGANDDLAVFHGLDNKIYYHCRHLLSTTYATILSGKEHPSALIMETVRSNSKEYPRPVSIEIFEYPPFNFTPEDIQGCLKELADTPEAKDISFVESSVGTIYLYSDKYLDETYAAFLAENADLAMITSP